MSSSAACVSINKDESPFVHSDGYFVAYTFNCCSYFSSYLSLAHVCIHNNMQLNYS